MKCTLISLLSISSMSFVNVAPSCVTISTIADSLPTILPGAIELLATVVETVRYIMCLLTLNFNLKVKYALKAPFIQCVHPLIVLWKRIYKYPTCRSFEVVAVADAIHLRLERYYWIGYCSIAQIQTKEFLHQERQYPPRSYQDSISRHCCNNRFEITLKQRQGYIIKCYLLYLSYY